MLFSFIIVYVGAVLAQSVKCLNTDWATGIRSPAEAKNVSYSLCVQTRSGAHPVSCTMGTGGPFPGVKCDRSVTLIAGRPVIETRSV
jgi:hypothetical protein